MLEVMELTKKYGSTLAADGVGFTVPDGKVGILLGPNGAGKSTVIKSIAGLLRYQGSIRIQGLDARTVEAKRRFAYVPELPCLYEALTVREHIEFILRAYGVAAKEERIRELLDQFELTDKQDKLGNELSKGMMQKVSICCALVTEPDVILLDEPMVGLDPAAIKELKEVILKLRDRGCTVLISTHMLEMVKELWDVTFVMDKGHILGIYAREDLADEDLEELFFKVTGQGEKAAVKEAETRKAPGGDAGETVEGAETRKAPGGDAGETVEGAETRKAPSGDAGESEDWRGPKKGGR